MIPQGPLEIHKFFLQIPNNKVPTPDCNVNNLFQGIAFLLFNQFSGRNIISFFSVCSPHPAAQKSIQFRANHAIVRNITW